MIAPPERHPPPGTERKSSAETPEVFSEDFARFRRHPSVGPNQAMSPPLAPLHENDSSPDSSDEDRKLWHTHCQKDALITVCPTALNLPIRSGVPAENALDEIDAQVHNTMFAHMSGLGNTLRPTPSYVCNDEAEASNWRKDAALSDMTMVVPPMQTMQQMQESSNPPPGVTVVKPTPPTGKKAGGTSFTKCPDGERMHCLVVDDDT